MQECQERPFRSVLSCTRAPRTVPHASAPTPQGRSTSRRRTPAQSGPAGGCPWGPHGPPARLIAEAPTAFERPLELPELRAVRQHQYPTVGERDRKRRGGQIRSGVMRHQELPGQALPVAVQTFAVCSPREGVVGLLFGAFQDPLEPGQGFRFARAQEFLYGFRQTGLDLTLQIRLPRRLPQPEWTVGTPGAISHSQTATSLSPVWRCGWTWLRTLCSLGEGL